MSRIAKDPVVIPDSVTVTAEGNTMKFKGPKGELSLDVHESVASLLKIQIYKSYGKVRKKQLWPGQ